jgi:hypothetical protein
MIAGNKSQAGSAYKAPSSSDIASDDPNGLPWGSVPLKGVFGGKSSDKKSYSSREGSAAPSKASSSSRG